jgi:hypothetical protein
VLAPVPDQTVSQGGTLSLAIEATDPDLPPNDLSYSLVSGPAGAVIHRESGLLTWNSASGTAASVITVQVTDNGIPPLSDTVTFKVSLIQGQQPALKVTLRGDHIELAWPSAFTGFRLECKDELQPGAAWTAVAALPVLAGAEFKVTERITNSRMYYRLTNGASGQSAALGIQRSGGRIVLTWPDRLDAMVLETTDQLTPPRTWAVSPAVPQLVNGEFSVSLDPSDKLRFFRLRAK